MKRNRVKRILTFMCCVACVFSFCSVGYAQTLTDIQPSAEEAVTEEQGLPAEATPSPDATSQPAAGETENPVPGDESDPDVSAPVEATETPGSSDAADPEASVPDEAPETPEPEPSASDEVLDPDIFAQTETQETETMFLAESGVVKDGNTEYVAGEVLVSFKAGVSLQSAQEAITDIQETQGEQKRISSKNKTKYNKVQIADDITVEQAVSDLLQDPSVADAQPNYLYSLMEEQPEAVTPLSESGAQPMTTAVDDPLQSYQWYLSAVGAYDAWDVRKTNRTVTVAVIDSGVDLNHPDLINNLDTALCYDEVRDTPLTAPGYETGHGTHVAGIIAAEANNAAGVAGVSYNANIIAINVFQYSFEVNDYRATSQDVADAVDRAVSDGAKVINLSLGGYSDRDAVMQTAVTSAVQSGVVVVCAGGNDGISALTYPSDYEACISVVPVDSGNYEYGDTNGLVDRPFWANYNEYKDISAPGVYIASTVPGGSYEAWDGSSMAAPVVSAIAAMLIAENPSLTVGQVKDILYSTATDLGTPGKDIYYGWGEVNAYEALAPSLDSIEFEYGPSSYQMQFSISALGVTAPSGIQGVEFGIYNQASGEGTEQRFSGVAAGEGNYSMDFDVNDFGEYGTFIVKVYGTDNNGYSRSMAQSTFEVKQDTAGPTATSVLTAVVGPTYQTVFGVNATEVQSASGIASMIFKVYAIEKGPDAGRIYTGQDQGGGSYSMSFDIADFSYVFGTYAIEAYAQSNSGIFNSVGWTTIEVRRDDGPSMTSFAVGTSNPTYESSFTVTAEGVSAPSGVRQVVIKAYPLSQGVGSAVIYNCTASGNNYTAAVHISDFGDASGTYALEVYGVSNSGVWNALGWTTLAVQGINMSSFYIGTTNPTYQTTFQVNAMGVRSANGISSVDFKVYNLASGSEAGKIYHGVDHGSGNYAMYFNIEDFSYYFGTYAIEVYGTSGNGEFKTLGWTTIEVRQDSGPSMTGFAVGTSNPTYESSFTVTAEGVTALSGVRQVVIKAYPLSQGVGSAVIYNCTASGNNYTATVRISDFGDASGTYALEAYGVSNSGVWNALGWTTLAVQGINMSSFYIGTTNPTYQTTFQVNAMGVRSANGISSVDFKVYNLASGSEAGKIYHGVDHGGGNYAMYFNIEDFSYYFGTYAIEVYGTSGNGEFKTLGWTTIEVRQDSGPSMTGFAVGTSNPTYESSFTVTAEGVTALSGVRQVVIKAYPLSQGVGSAVIYNCTASGNNYTATVRISDFGDASGTYALEAYGVSNSGVWNALGWTTIVVNSLG